MDFAKEDITMNKHASLLKVLTLGLSAIFLCAQASAQETTQPEYSLDDIVDGWLASPHASFSSEAFTHWNEDGEIPATCAVCHSSRGAVDYMRGDMSTAGIIDHPVPTGTAVDCTTCHTSAASELSTVPFPSGASVTDLGPSAVCTVCHQGRAATQTVERATAELEDDVISDDLTFINIHYFATAASLFGTEVQGGFEYPDKEYRGRFTHVPNLNGCVNCHQPHTLEVELESCTSCHQGVESFADIRMSPIDFDGDGDTSEGISNPINAMHEQLGQAIQVYATDVVGTAIVYDSGSYPYFFVDGDMDGAASADEAIFPNRYQSWTPRMLRAAYNYQVVAKDPAIYTHNPHYALQFLYDSLESLSAVANVDMSNLTRP